jgi:hypothetical protein
MDGRRLAEVEKPAEAAVGDVAAEVVVGLRPTKIIDRDGNHGAQFTAGGRGSSTRDSRLFERGVQTDCGGEIMGVDGGPRLSAVAGRGLAAAKRHNERRGRTTAAVLFAGFAGSESCESAKKAGRTELRPKIFTPRKEFRG